MEKKVQYSETPKEGIVREFTEETGLVLIESKLRGEVLYIDKDTTVKRFELASHKSW